MNTPQRHFRVSDDIWERAAARAKREGTNLSAVIRSWLALYADGKGFLIRREE